MRTSEALQIMYSKIFNREFPPIGYDLQHDYTQLALIFAQSPQLAEDQLGILTFKIPADIQTTLRSDPEKAEKMLITGIVGCMVWEDLITIENSGPTEEEWSDYLNQIGFWETLKNALEKKSRS